MNARILNLRIVPDGWPVRFGDLRPGLFVNGDSLAVLTDYGDPYLAGGDAWWGGASTKVARAEIVVQPVKAEWVKDG